MRVVRLAGPHDTRELFLEIEDVHQMLSVSCVGSRLNVGGPPDAGVTHFLRTHLASLYFV